MKRRHLFFFLLLLKLPEMTAMKTEVRMWVQTLPPGGGGREGGRDQVLLVLEKDVKQNSQV